MALIDRLVHSCTCILRSRGCSGSLIYNHNTDKWILGSGTSLANNCVDSFIEYRNTFKLRDLAYNNGYIVDGIIKNEIEFNSISSATQFVFLRPNSYVGVYESLSKIKLKKNT